MGPFSLVNPNSGLALGVEHDDHCANGMKIKSAPDDHSTTRQKFYLGQHGSIFSANCPGLVVASPDSAISSHVKLEIFRINEKKLKWKFSDGMIESVSRPGMFLASDSSGNNIILQDKNTTISELSGVNWIRKNTRLLPSNNVQSEWKQIWVVSFIASDYKGPSLEEFSPDNTSSNGHSDTTCFNVNSAFSPSFESFARELAINDASDEDQCRNVREKLGFDKDHPFDEEVKASFNQHKCDPFFTGIDHESGEDMEAMSVSRFSVFQSCLLIQLLTIILPFVKAPPHFEMMDFTPVEYEAVEYVAEEYKSVSYSTTSYTTIDYEHFMK